jgi:hypothetical protein
MGNKWIWYGIAVVVSLEVLRHFTWGHPGEPDPEKAFQTIGMSPYTSVDRRA